MVEIETRDTVGEPKWRIMMYFNHDELKLQQALDAKQFFVEHRDGEEFYSWKSFKESKTEGNADETTVSASAELADAVYEAILGCMLIETTKTYILMIQQKLK